VTKADIASLVAEKGLTKKQAMDAVEATLEILKNVLRLGEKIQLVGFGSFQVRAKRARKGRNPQTGSEITISARKVLKFKPGKALHQIVNQGAVTQDNGQGASKSA
jgi:nucleoid DNA-binding protein